MKPSGVAALPVVGGVNRFLATDEDPPSGGGGGVGRGRGATSCRLSVWRFIAMTWALGV